MRLKTLLAIMVVGLSVAGWSPKAEAKLLTYDMSWSGESGYSMTGAFSFDDADLPASRLVGPLDLLSFEATAFEPDGTALETYAFTSTDFSVFLQKSFIINFNFESDTEVLRQTGSPAGVSPDGLAFGGFTAGGPALPNGWLLFGGSSCGPTAGLAIILTETTAGCSLSTLKDFSRDSFVQVSLRGGPVADAQIPEPGTLALFGLGIAGIGFAVGRKRA